MAEDIGERTELPTPRRRQEAREKGQVAKSTDLAAAIELGGGIIVVALLGAWIASEMGRIMRSVLDRMGDDRALGAPAAAELAQLVAVDTAKVLAPPLAIMALIAVLAYICQFGVLFTLRPLKPDLNRLNPIEGTKRLLSLRSAAKAGVNSLKLTLVICVSVGYIILCLPRMAALPSLSMAGALLEAGAMIAALMVWLVVVLLILGLIDFAYQRWQHTRDLRMTRQQVQDERRNMDGDPLVKGKRLRMAREIAMQRVRQDVPRADVVVTNPTHYAVAIRYDQATMNAPRVVAKGADFMAAHIRQVAMTHGVPIVERPALARAIYAAVPVGREVSPQFYQAVAEILAYVYRLGKKAA